MKPKFNAICIFLSSIVLFTLMLHVILNPDGIWVNQWGYLQKVGALLVLLISARSCMFAGRLLVSPNFDLDAALEKATRNPRVPEAE